MKQLTPQQRLERAHVWLLNEPATVAFGGIVLMGNSRIASDRDGTSIDTAATDGLNIYYNPDFIAELSDEELRGLIIHENMHIAYRQIWLWKHLPDKRLLNMAMDYVINLEIVGLHPDIRLPSGGLVDTRYAGMDTQQVYHALKQEQDENGGGGAGNGGKPLDDHDFGNPQNADEQQVAAAIDAAIRQGQIMAGKIGAGRSRTLDKLIEPVVDWRQVLQQFLQDTCAGKDESTWRKPNRRYLYQGIYMPSTISETVGRLVIGVDTSGSIDGELLTTFMSEVMGVLRNVTPECVDILYWDTRVARHETYMPDAYDRLPQTTKPAGGGGTDPACVPAYLSTNQIKPVAIIMLTDGYVCGWGDNYPAPVIWCIKDNKQAVPPFGVTCHI